MPDLPDGDAACKAGQPCCEIAVEHKMEHHGHRARLDLKAREAGLEFLPAHEQLEKLLFVAVPRGNTNETAHLLLRRFGSIYGVLTAEVQELMQVPGVGRRVAEYLHDLPAVLGIVERSALAAETAGAPILDTPEKLGAFAVSLFRGAVVEKFYLISLNARNRVIRFDKISEGTIDETAVYTRKVAKTALLNEAYAVVLAHNHPSGQKQPSYADLERTRAIARALEASEIILRDHIIVAGSEWISMEQMNML